MDGGDGRLVQVVAALALDVGDLPPHHAARPRRPRHHRQRVQNSVRGQIKAALGNEFKGQCQQGVARQDRHRLAVDDVVGRAAPAQVVVVNRRQVVVDQGKGVDALHGAGQRQGLIGVAADGLRAREGQDGAQALAAAEQGVAYGLVQSCRRLRRGRQVGVQGLVHPQPTLAQVGGKVEGHAPPAGPPSAARGVLAAVSVLRSSMAMVIGPTPPGTGVMAEATRDAPANSTSPTSPPRPATRL